MSDSFSVTGADQFLRLSKALKAAGRTELRRELNKAMRDAAKPLIPKAKAAARAKLPRSGGLAEQVARESFRAQTRTGRDPGVRVVVGKKRGGAGSTNRGSVRHPVFGNPNAWVVQSLPQARGWFDDTMRADAPAIRGDLERALQAMADKIVREAK